MCSKNIFLKIVVFLFALTYPSISHSQDSKKELVMGVGLAIPPYVFKKSNSGMELDIVREALKNKGYSIKPKYLPLKRLTKSLKDRTVDGALTVKETMGIKGVFFAKKSHIYYQNVAVSLKGNNFEINNMMDLKDYRIIVFQNADQYVGKEWLEMKKVNNNEIKEMANQESQVAMLFLKRSEIIVLDINIFKYYRKTTKKADTSAQVVVHEVLPKNHVKVAFFSKKVRDDYNDGLAEFMESGGYQKILNKYIGK